jgi:hypothetical protein
MCTAFERYEGIACRSPHFVYRRIPYPRRLVRAIMAVRLTYHVSVDYSGAPGHPLA